MLMHSFSVYLCMYRTKPLISAKIENSLFPIKSLSYNSVLEDRPSLSYSFSYLPIYKGVAFISA